MERRTVSALVEVVEGASLHVRAGARLVRSPSLLLHCLPCCLLTLSTALAAATTVWLPLQLARLPPLRLVVEFDVVLRLVSVLVLQLAQAVWPSLSGRVFFATLEECGQAEEARRLRDLPTLRGLGAQLRTLAAGLVASLGAAALIVATAALWLPLALAAGAAAWAAVILTSPVWLIGAGLMLALVARLLPMLHTWGLLRQLPMPLVLLAAALLSRACGLLPRLVYDSLVRAALACLLAAAHAHASLAQLSIRQTDAAWRQWCAASSVGRWRLVGLGLPVWGVVAFAHPLASLALLEVAHVSAALFVGEVGWRHSSP